MKAAVDALVVALQGAIDTPDTDGSVLGDLARQWLMGEGDRYFLRSELRALLSEIQQRAIAGEPAPAEDLTRWLLLALDLQRRLEPVRNPYLDPATARERAIGLGVFTEESAPSIDRFASALDRLCDMIHQWLGRRLAATTYTKTLASDRWGRLRLPEWPVLGVERIAIQRYTATGQPLFLTPIRSYWTGLREIETGLRDCTFEVTYTAGLDPVPAAVRDCLIDLLVTAIEQDPTLRAIDHAWFSSPYRDVEMVRLPGGLEKSFAIPEGGGAAAAKPPSQLDRLLYPLTAYRTKGTILC